jgi:signal transduction histidine kinase
VRQGLGLAVKKERVDVAEVARAALLELGEPEQGRASFVASGDTTVECDRGRMLQIASNLVGNALRHGGGGTVGVEVAGDAAEVVLSVHNDGPLIDPELLPFVFEPFRQGADPGAKLGSTGLGLFIVREIVTAHGGTVAVASDAKSGTTFSVRLPRALDGEP